MGVKRGRGKPLVPKEERLTIYQFGIIEVCVGGGGLAPDDLSI